MEKNNSQRVGSLINISDAVINNIWDLELDIIAHDVHQQRQEGNKSFDVTLSNFGNLNIAIDGDELVYRFIPSKEVIHKINNTLKSKESPLIKRAEASLVNKLNKYYKDLL